jgi:LysR family transcriptional regulator AphB
MELDLNDVALFVHVVREGSFAAAARRLGLPPNTASRRIQQLEASLGLRLLQRSTRKLTPTDAGRTLYQRCAEQVASLAAAAQEISAGQQLAIGTLRVAAPAAFFDWFLMDWIAEFLAAHPQLRVEFLLNDARADLIGESIDVAFRAGPIHEPNLVARPLGTSSSCLVASPAYLAMRGAPLTLSELARHDCIAFPAPGGQATWALTGPHGPEEVNISGRFSADSAQALLQAAAAGLGIALLPSLLAAPLLHDGRLRQVLPDYTVAGRGVYFVYPSHRQLARAVSAFVEFAAEKIQQRGLAGAMAAPPIIHQGE